MDIEAAEAHSHQICAISQGTRGSFSPNSPFPLSPFQSLEGSSSTSHYETSDAPLPILHKESSKTSSSFSENENIILPVSHGETHDIACLHTQDPAESSPSLKVESKDHIELPMSSTTLIDSVPVPLGTLQEVSCSDLLVQSETLENRARKEGEEEEEEEEEGLGSSSPDHLVANNLTNYTSFPWSSCNDCVPTKYSISPSLVGAGLENLGNTCFLNVILQCFTHTVPLVQGLRSCSHAKPCDRQTEDFCLICALCNFMDCSLAFSGRVFSPSEFVDNLSYFSSCFQRYQQEDAHEFLQCLLDRLERSYMDLRIKNKLSLENDDINKKSLENDDIVKKVFGGSLISRLRCCNCGHCSDTHEPLIDLSLEIEDVDNLASALKSFTNVERIEDSDIKFSCENCKQEGAIDKQLMLDKAPSIAAFHLKRFKSDGFFVEKIDKHVEYPLELDLGPYICGSQDLMELSYELYAVVVHIGLSSSSGHYFCFVRPSPDTWYKLDDTKVTRVLEETALSQSAYILFYARQGTPWFSSLIEAQKLCPEPNILNTSPTSVLDPVGIVHTPNGIPNAYSHEINDQLKAAAEEIPTELRDVGSVKEARDDNSIHTLKQVDGRCGHEGTSTTTSEVGKDAKDCPLTPLRSPSPNIYSKESPPAVGYFIPRGHLRSHKASCKRPLDKALEDSQRREAARYVSKSMPTSRGRNLMAALFQNEDSSRKRSKRRGIVSV